MKLANPLKCKIAIIGLGYVGLPLATEISKKNTVAKLAKRLIEKLLDLILIKLG